MSEKIKEDQLKFRHVKSVDSQWIYAVHEEKEWQLPKSINDKLNSSPKGSDKSKSLANNELRSDNDRRQESEISGEKIESTTVRSTQDNQGQVQSGATNIIVTRLPSSRRLIECDFCLETHYSMQYYSTTDRKTKSCLNCLGNFKSWSNQGENLDETGQQLDQRIELSIKSTAPGQSESVFKAHPCPKDDTSQHMFHGHELRKFHESCQHLEQQVGLSTKKTVPKESYKPRIASKRRLSPAQDAKLHKFHGNEFKRAPECRAEIKDPKPKDNKSAVTTAYVLPKQINWIQRQRNQIQSRMISQEKPMFSNSIRKIGKESNLKMNESRDFRKDTENQFNDTTSSRNKWEPENLKILRSTYGSPVKSNIQCRSEHQIDNKALENNQFKRQGAEEQVNRRATTASSQLTITSERTRCHLRDAKQHMINQNATPEILKPLESRSKFDYSIVNDYKPKGQELSIQSTWSQRQSLELDKIEIRKPKFENSIFDKGRDIEKVTREHDLKQGSSNFCQEIKKCRLVFDITSKSNDWREQEHQTNDSLTLNNTINSKYFESDRPKVENQRQGHKFTQFEDQMPRYEVLVYTMFDQKMGFDIGKKYIIEHQGYSGPYQPCQYKKSSQDMLETPKDLDKLSSNVVSQSLTLDNPVDTKPDSPNSSDKAIFRDIASMVVNEWQRSKNRYGPPPIEILNFGTRQFINSSEWPKLIIMSTYSENKIIIQMTYGRHGHRFNGKNLKSVVKIILPSIVIPNRFLTWCSIIKALTYVTLYVSILDSKSRRSTSLRTWQRLKWTTKSCLRKLMESRTSNGITANQNNQIDIEIHHRIRKCSFTEYIGIQVNNQVLSWISTRKNDANEATKWRKKFSFKSFNRRCNIDLTWTFIPPTHQHMIGSYERLINSAKSEIQTLEGLYVVPQLGSLAHRMDHETGGSVRTTGSTKSDTTGPKMSSPIDIGSWTEIMRVG